MSTKSASSHLVKHRRHLSLQLLSLIPSSVFNFNCLLDIATDGCSNSKKNLYLWFLISLISCTRKSRSAALASRVLYSRHQNTNEEKKMAFVCLCVAFYVWQCICLVAMWQQLSYGDGWWASGEYVDGGGSDEVGSDVWNTERKKNRCCLKRWDIY